MREHKEVNKFIDSFVSSILPGSEISYSTDGPQLKYYVNIYDKNNSCTITFNRSFMDDFENVLLKDTDRKNSYYFAYESKVRFDILVRIGLEGLIPDYKVSERIVDDKRNWVEDNYKTNLEINNEFSDLLFYGLKSLFDFLDSSIKRHPTLELKSYKEDREYINGIIKSYPGKGKNLSEKEVSAKSLGFLKAAALAEIIKLENEKKNATSTVRKEIDKKLYFVVAEIREMKFINVKLPGWIEDYNESLKDEHGMNMTKLTNEVFVIMQIGNSELDKIWREVYCPVIKKFNLEPKRVDRHNEGKLINSEIADFLTRSKLIIADLTNERQNCYLEVGYAMGIKKFSNLILVAREDHCSDSPNYKREGPKIHFDLSGYDFLWWHSDKLEEFKMNLEKKIKYRLSVIYKTDAGG